MALLQMVEFKCGIGLIRSLRWCINATMDYKVGDVVNGHVLGADMQWHPVTQQPPAHAEFKGVNGTIMFDGDFITIRRTGFLARATVGKGEKRVPLASITAVQWKPAGPLVNGFIQFTMGGSNERRSAFGHQTSSAASDENSVVFNKGQMPSFSDLREQVERAIAARNRPAPAAQTTAAAPDHMGQLRQLGELRDAGILTPEEFEMKKADILRRM